MLGDKFIQTIQSGYTFKGQNFKIGTGMLAEVPYAEAPVYLPLKTMNRHGLIAGATGTGKTKTLQMIVEGLSDQGVAVMVMDIKGDLSGLAAEGVENGFIKKRYHGMGEQYLPKKYPVELLSLSHEKGARLRATVTEFGPLLLAKVLELNDTQEGILAMLFKYCDEQNLPLLDLKDLIKVIQFASEEGKIEIEREYGRISTASLGTILRKIIALQQQDADLFFGEISFEPDDLMRLDAAGNGIISVLRLTDLQDRPKLFSTFMLQLLAELYATLPEAGDLEKPKLVMFIDEAHLIFKEANKSLLDQIESIVKLIRSKGVGIFFCTQNPQDVPQAVLGQLGLKVQHALRAFTAKDRKDIRQTAQNYPDSDFYKTEELLTQVGIGEAIVTLLNEKGIPTPLVHVQLMSPRSRMDILTEIEIDELTSRSVLIPKYNTNIDRDSAYEILNRRLEQYKMEQMKQAETKRSENASTKKTTNTQAKKQDKSWLEKTMNSSAGRQVQRSLVRTIFGVVQRMMK